MAGEPGTLDQSFAAGGKFTYQQGGMPSVSWGLTVQPDRKIVVTGESGEEASLQALTVRVNPDGSLDDSFGTGGAVLTVIGEVSGAGRVKRSGDGQRIFVAGGDSPDGENSRMDLVAYGHHDARPARDRGGGDRPQLQHRRR